MPVKKIDLPDENTPEETADEVPMIVYREPYVENVGGQAVQMFREHRVPLMEWAAYSAEHGF